MLEGEYAEIEPEARLVFTWRHVTEKPAGERTETATSKVTVTFAPESAMTKVTVRHEGIQTVDGLNGVGHGWEGTFVNLDAMLDHL